MQTVRYIFSRFLEGKSPYTIAKELMARGDKTGTGGTVWHADCVVLILKNEKYAGNAILQKTYKTDLLAKRRVNCGEVQKYYVKDNHEPIITQEEYEMTQVELEERKNTLHQHSSKGIFSSRIICGDCGDAYGPKVWHSNEARRKIIWRCNSKYHNAKKCTTPHLYEDQIKDIFVKAVNKFLTDKTSVITDLKEVRKMLLDTSDLEKQLADAQVELDCAEGAFKNYFDGRPITEEDGGKFESYQAKYTQAKEKVDNLTNQINDRKNRSRKMQRFISQVETMDDLVDSFSEKMFTGLVDHILVKSKTEIVVVFKCGTEVTITEW